MRFYVNFESWEEGRSSLVGRQRVPDSRSSVTKRTFTEGFQVCFWNFEQSFCRRTKGARWLICAERRQVWRKSAVKVMESKRYKLVLNAVFYWEPVEFFQKRCDMITLRLFQDEPCGVVLGLLYARDLFIGYTCERSIVVVQSWRDHRRNKLFCGTVREEQTYRGDSPECKKRSAAEATDVLFHWQCLVKMHSKVRNGGLKRNATATYICRHAADRTDAHWWTYKHHLSFFLCKASVCCFASMTKYCLYRIECWTEQKRNRQVVHCQRFLCHQRTSDSHSYDRLWHQTGVVNTGWIVQVRGPISEEHQRQGVLVWTSNHQAQQTASNHLGMTQTKTALLPRFQKCSQVVLIGWHGQGCQKQHSDPTVQVLTYVSDQTL